MEQAQGREAVSPAALVAPSVTADVSGAGMDRRVPRSRLRKLAPYLAGVAVVLLVGALWLVRPAGGSVQTVSGARLTVAAVEQGLFEDFIPARGTVEPARTVYLDAVAGGRVERVEAQDGQMVEEGDLIVVLSNNQQQLQVIQTEASVTEQLNMLRNLELQMQQRKLSHASMLVDIDYQIVRLERQAARLRPLVDQGAESPNKLEDVLDELEYARRRREVTIEAQATDERIMQAQMEELRANSANLERNLAVARDQLDDLSVRAPIAGVLTALDAEVGQSIAQGTRIGQIDSPDAFKLTASLDEFYLPRVSVGLLARADIDGQSVPSRVSRIYPQVESGQFTAELLFEGEEPGGLRRGQSLPLRLYLAEAEDALLLPAGAFLAETGGNWAFVLSPDGSVAEKRTIRTGRRNTRFVEVLDGLDLGERVIVSSYEPFGDVERLELN